MKYLLTYYMSSKIDDADTLMWTDILLIRITYKVDVSFCFIDELTETPRD